MAGRANHLYGRQRQIPLRFLHERPSERNTGAPCNGLLANAHKAVIENQVRSWRPDLLEQVGFGPVIAATVLIVWSHPGRIRNEAAFAMLSGVAPIPASSGLTTRHRLNRRGDRNLNSALHIVTTQRQ